MIDMQTILKSIDPATGKIIATYKSNTDKEVEVALSQAIDTFDKWRKMSFAKRGSILKRIAKEIRKEKNNLVALAASEMGKPMQQGHYEVEKCASTLEFYANRGAEFLKDEVVKTDAIKSYVSFQPLGTVLAVMPWNFPYWQVFRAFAPTVMAGNVMILKHASNVSGCALAIEKLIIKAGAPAGLLQTLLIGAERVEGLIDDDRIAAVTLTGSTTAGRKVAAAAGRNLKKAVLELGGSDPYIILADADMNKAVEIAVRGRLVNTGQSCIAAKRFVVDKKVKKEFEVRLTEEMKKVTFGNPMDESNRMGPMARLDLRDELHKQVVDSIAKGAKLLCGGYVPELAGAFYPATVLTDVKKGMPAYDEELFGPVAAIIEAKDEITALKIANDTIYGLGGGIISNNRKLAERLAKEELQAGNCYVNDFVHSDPLLPFGGIKQSGYGRELGTFGIREFVNIKSVYIK
jgi:succinate-semialdehyde dehydrogenase/glutarate-semialdehyde dehydrogenase